MKPNEVAELDPYEKRKEPLAKDAKALLGEVAPTPEIEAGGSERFSKEARESLEKEGYVIYELTGQSLKSLREQGRKFWSDWTKDYDLDTLPSRKSEVAINPSQLFLPDSNNKILDEQLEMIEAYDEDIYNKYPGVRAMLGEVSDYAELAYAHLDKTGQYLFDSSYTRTITKVESYVAGVGSFNADDGLDVDGWSPGTRHDRLRAAPLVVPTGTK